MTRFARAKGSKASNEKAPEDGTPWEVMKEQLVKAKKESEESKKRQEAEKQRIENYENFLKEQRVKKKPATWCDFPEDVQPQQNNNNDDVQQPKKKKKKSTTEDDSQIKCSNGELKSKKVKKKKNKCNVEDSVEMKAVELPKNKEEQKFQKTGPEQSSNDVQVEPQQSPNKKKKKKKQKKDSLADDPTNNDSSTHAQTQDKDINIRKQKKNKKTNSNYEEITENTKQNINKINKEKAKKKKKLVDGKPARRKEINDRSFPIIINGKEVELVRFDGFPIMKRDAERLSELRNNMIKKGIPKSEVQRTMKLERRRAEKALARVKRDVCYNCRKGGHNLSDCPELKSKIPGADTAQGVCFKCGSTEHRQFECKVQRDKEFRFASCFICKEQGHIARQCPDNPKGLYPNGGSCKLCGDVTHLRKDCPTMNHQKEETSVKLPTLESTENIEDIGVQNKSTTYDDSVKKPKKIKF